MTDEAALLQNFLVLGAILFAVGMIGFVVRRNMIIMFLCAEMMLQGVSLSLVAWGRWHNDWGGQSLVIFIITIAACEAAIALALILLLFHQRGSLDIVVWQEVREEGRPPHVDREIPEETAEDRAWPTLTPAGIEPEAHPEEQQHRERL